MSPFADCRTLAELRARLRTWNRLWNLIREASR